MELKHQTFAGAFSEGADLWLIPSPQISHWSRQIDWYLNLQVARAQSHESPVNSNSAPLLIASRRLVPARQTVIIPEQENQEQWITQSYEVWRSLNFPHLKVFLPPDILAETFQSVWGTFKGPERRVYFVSDTQGNS